MTRVIHLRPAQERVLRMLADRPSGWPLGLPETPVRTVEALVERHFAEYGRDDRTPVARIVRITDAGRAYIAKAGAP